VLVTAADDRAGFGVVDMEAALIDGLHVVFDAVWALPP
jgi:hypothetical protein